jgi:hypothetical protein
MRGQREQPVVDAGIEAVECRRAESRTFTRHELTPVLGAGPS